MKTLIDENSIQVRISEMALEISTYYKKQDWYKYTNQPVHLIGIMLGAVPFTTDLIKQLSIHAECHWIRVSSYYNNIRAASLPKILAKPEKRFCGDTPFNNHILLVDDILETGVTLDVIREKYKWPGDDIRIAVLLRKKRKVTTGVTADFVGFDIEDEWVAGYGMDDCNGQRREIPFIFTDDTE